MLDTWLAHSANDNPTFTEARFIIRCRQDAVKQCFNGLGFLPGPNVMKELRAFRI